MIYLSLAICSATNWPQFRSVVRHTGINRAENVLSTTNVSNLDMSWSASTDGGIFSSPAVVNGVVYVGSVDGHMYAFNAQTGTILWTSAPLNAFSQSSPAVANGVVYVGTGDNNLYAFNAGTGMQL